MAKLDDASWHETATHIGMFVAWTILAKLWRGEPSHAAATKDVRRRAITGRQFLMRECDGKLSASDLTEEGAAFAENYYPERYMADYRRLLVQGLASDYAVEDSWANYDRVAPAIDRQWRAFA